MGPIPPGAESGDLAESFTTFAFAIKRDFTERLSAALIYDQPFGADVAYPVQPYFAAGSTATVDSDALTALLRYKLDRGFSIHGGPALPARRGRRDDPLRHRTRRPHRRPALHQRVGGRRGAGLRLRRRVRAPRHRAARRAHLLFGGPARAADDRGRPHSRRKHHRDRAAAVRAARLPDGRRTRHAALRLDPLGRLGRLRHQPSELRRDHRQPAAVLPQRHHDLLAGRRPALHRALLRRALGRLRGPVGRLRDQPSARPRA